MRYLRRLPGFVLLCVAVVLCCSATAASPFPEVQEVESRKNPQSLAKGATYDGLPSDEFMTGWLVLGPIPVFHGKPNPEDQETQRSVFETEYLRPEKLGSVLDGTVSRIEEVEYRWRYVQAKDAIVDFTEAYGDTEFVVAYAWAEINMPEPKTVLLGLGSDDGVKVWLNGELIHENWIGRPVVEDDDLFPADFKQGSNHLLLKIQNMQLAWGFSCRPIGPKLFPEKLVSFAGRGDLDALELLLSHGADVNTATDPGLTALHAARIHGREAAARLLLEKGANPDVRMPPKEALVDAICRDLLKEHEPGAAILVAQDGRVLYEKGFGSASLAHDVPVTPATKFRIGSITKQFTAAAILKLQEDGLLSVDDPLSKYLADFPRGDEVTLHHLLTHTSGIHSYTEKEEFMKTVTVEVKPEELIKSIKKDTFDFDPGEQWRYNNSGYFLLGYIVEKVSGQPYGQFLKASFFEPLGMKDTGVHRWSTVLEHEAAGYSWIDGEFQNAKNWDMSRAGGAGALYSTVKDLYLWNEAVFNGKVIRDASLAAALTPVTLNDGTGPSPSIGGYGYGWAINEFRGLKEISHGGGLHGFVSYLARYPEHNTTVVVLANCAPARRMNPSAAAHDIAEIYLWEKMAAQESYSTDTTVDPAVYDEYSGRYEYPGGAVLIVTREGDRLYAQMTAQPKFEIFPRSETEFFWKVVDAQITFVRDGNGNVVHAIHRQGGQEFKAPRLVDETPAEVDPALYKRYVGEYELAPNTKANITTDGARIFVQVTGQPKFELFPRSETEYFLKVAQARLTFVQDEAGEVTSLVLEQGGRTLTARKLE